MQEAGAGSVVQGKYVALFAARFEHPCSLSPEDFSIFKSVWGTIHLFRELIVPATNPGDVLNNLIAIRFPSTLNHFTNVAWVLLWGFFFSSCEVKKRFRQGAASACSHLLDQHLLGN